MEFVNFISHTKTIKQDKTMNVLGLKIGELLGWDEHVLKAE